MGPGDRLRRAVGPLAAAGLASVVAASSGATPVVIDPSWEIVRTDTIFQAQAARFHPMDGRIYALSLTGDLNGGGLYRIEADGSLTLIAAAFRPRGLVIEPQTGTLFHTEGAMGAIYRTVFGASGRDTWVTGFHPGDDDPIGLAIAPLDYTGSVVAPGDGIVVDEGTGGPAEIWQWFPGSPEGEQVIHPEDGTLGKPVDVAIGKDKVWVADQNWHSIVEVAPDGSVTALPTAAPITLPRSVAVDPTDQTLWVADSGIQTLVHVDPVSGSVDPVASGFTWVGASGIGTTPDGVELIVSDHDASEVYTFSRLASLGAAGALACGGGAGDALVTPGELRAFTFLAGEADRVGLVAVPDAGSSVSPRAVLFAPDRSRVSLADDYGGCAGFCASATLPMAGPYTAVFFDAAHAASGGYRIGLESLSGSLLGASNAGVAPVCGGPDGVVALACGIPGAGTFAAIGDTDAFTFDGEAGDTVRITTAPSGGSATLPLALLFAPGGDGVALGGSTAACPGACDSDPLPIDGTYTVLVFDALLTATGGYDVSLDELVGGVPACDNACGNGVDDDGDGAIDAADVGCSSPDDFSEEPACSDGIDNDGDGLVDVGADPACVTAGAFFEDPACDDGRDQDGDGTQDWDGFDWNGDLDFDEPGELPPDPNCINPWTKREKRVAACGLGAELALILAPLMHLAARRRRS